MKVTRNLGMFLFGAWVVITGLSQVAGFNMPGDGVIMAVLAIAAGVFIVLGR